MSLRGVYFEEREDVTVTEVKWVGKEMLTCAEGRSREARQCPRDVYPRRLHRLQVGGGKRQASRGRWEAAGRSRATPLRFH